jgi:hypothetical protein
MLFPFHFATDLFVRTDSRTAAWFVAAGGTLNQGTRSNAEWAQS